MASLLLILPAALVLLLGVVGKRLARVIAPVGTILFLVMQLIVSLVPQLAVQLSIPDTLAPIFVHAAVFDGLSRIALAAVAIVAIAVVLLMQSLVTSVKRVESISLLLIAIAGMNATLLAQDLFSLYLFIEVTAIAAFILIGAGKDRGALEGAFKYLILSAVASFLMLSGVGLALLIAGDTSFSAIANAFATAPHSMLVRIAIVVFMAGALIKSGVVPFHGWLPDAYSASPSAVSLLLAGIVTKATGVYVVIRLASTVFSMSAELRTALMALGALSIVIGAFAAMGQRHFKRMLAYSSISQVGYIILALGCGTKLAFIAAAFHFLNHAVFKGLLFANAAAVEQRAGTLDLTQMGGLTDRMPVTGTTALIGVLSTAGIPPLAGFWSKLLIIVALWQAGFAAYAVVALLASVVTLAYLLILTRRAFFGRLRQGLEAVREAQAGIVAAEIWLAAITIAIGLGFPLIFPQLLQPLGGMVP